MAAVRSSDAPPQEHQVSSTELVAAPGTPGYEHRVQVEPQAPPCASDDDCDVDDEASDACGGVDVPATPVVGGDAASATGAMAPAAVEALRAQLASQQAEIDELKRLVLASRARAAEANDNSSSAGDGAPVTLATAQTAVAPASVAARAENAHKARRSKRAAEPTDASRERIRVERKKMAALSPDQFAGDAKRLCERVRALTPMLKQATVNSALTHTQLTRLADILHETEQLLQVALKSWSWWGPPTAEFNRLAVDWDRSVLAWAAACVGELE